METRIINLIPTDYDGNPRGAPGYPWKKLVMAGNEVDRENSIPGEDLVGVSFADCLAALEAEHGPLATRDNDSYGWLRKVAIGSDGTKYNIEGVAPVAYVTGMWCGGPQESIYRISDAKPVQEKPAAPKKTTDTTAAKQPRRMEGYCYNCDSFCYGDCGRYTTDADVAIRRDMDEARAEQACEE